uniref:Uncharacterized protein n=1 Tax=Oryctolagus cuniculus TaxID=9986 RepID=A0A5F9C6A5_RABIT
MLSIHLCVTDTLNDKCRSLWPALSVKLAIFREGDKRIHAILTALNIKLRAPSARERWVSGAATGSVHKQALLGALPRVFFVWLGLSTPSPPPPAFIFP